MSFRKLTAVIIPIFVFSALNDCMDKTKPANGSLSVFAAASVRHAMEDLQKAFESAHPGTRLNVVFGSTGKAYAQIQNDAPYEMLFAADTETPRKLIESGLAVGKEIIYGTGRIAVWQRKGGKIDLSKGMQSLKNPEIRSIATANPEVAPYGRAVVEAFQKHGLWDSLKNKMVYGENLSQAAHFASSGAADLAVIAYSQVLSEDLKKNEGSYFVIDAADHHKLEQSFVILKKGSSNPAAQKFADFVVSSEGKAILKKHGF